MITAKTISKALFPLLALLFISSCKNTSDVPFPQNETEYAAPVTTHFKFDEPKKITWEPIDRDSIKPITETKVDLDKLPSEPFDIGVFKPFTKPMTETKIDWQHLPDTAFSYKNLPTEKLRFTTSILGKPLLVKAGAPSITDSAITNILVFERGLPGYTTGAILRDSRGILWVGTTEGLVRFDGENYSIYGRDQGMEGLQIWQLCEDSKGQIWIGTLDGEVEVLNQKAGIIKHLTSKIGHDNNGIWSLLADKSGQIWIGSADGVDIINEEVGIIKHLKHTEGLSGNYVASFLEESNGDIWIGTESGTDIIEKQTGKIKHLNKLVGLRNNRINALYENKAGEIWIGTLEGASILDKRAGIIKHLSIDQGLSNNEIRCFFEDRYGQMFIGSRGGGFDIVKEKEQMVKHISMKEGLSNRYVLNVIEKDRSHVWIATWKGLNLYDEKETFRYIHAGSRIGYDNIFGYLEDRNGRIWAGTDSGVYIIDKTLKTFQNLKLDKGVNAILEDSRGRVWMTRANEADGIYVLDPVLGIVKYINVPKTNSLLEDSNHDIWFGAYYGGLVGKISEEDFSISRLNTGQDFSKHTVYPNVKDSMGQIWMWVSETGLDIIDQKHGTYRQLTTANGFGDVDIVPFSEDSLHRIWARSEKSGLYMIDQAASTFTNFTVKQGLPDNFGTHIKTKQRDVFVLTPKGLTIISPSANTTTANQWQLTTYSDLQGVINSYKYSYLLLTKAGQLWWASNNWFTIMQPPKIDTTPTQTYLTGIDIINQPQYFPDNRLLQVQLKKSDTLWDPQKDSFYLKGQSPPSLNYFKENNIYYDSVTGAYNIPANLRLSYYQNYLTFHFTGAITGDVSKTVYRYVLEGADGRWSKISEEPVSKSYLNLPPGKYIFKVSSKGFNNVWSEPTEFSFAILPPWWKTWWAYTFYILLIALFAWTFSLYRSRNLQKQNKLLEEKVNLRTKELNNSLNELKSTQAQLIQAEKMASLGELTAGIAHEIQNPLNFVNNFSDVNTELINELKSEIDKGNFDEVKFIANDIAENEQKINHHGKRAGFIVKGMLQHSRTNTGQKEPTDLSALTDEYLKLSYHGLRAKDKSFNATIETNFDKNIGKIGMVPQDIGRVLLNLFNNAFYAVHAKNKNSIEGYEPTISVSTKKLQDKIEITVTDNGMGISKSLVDKIFQPFFTTKPTGQGTGLGLSLSYDIIKAHGGELKVESREGQGAMFCIELPTSERTL